MTTTKLQKRTGTSGPPVMPRPSGATAGPETLSRLRHFHLSGAAGEGTPEPAVDLMPALLHRFAEPDKVRTDYPLYLPPARGEEGETLCLPLPEFLKAFIPPPESSRVLADNAPRLERGVREILARGDRPAEAAAVFAEAGNGMLAELKLGPDERRKAEADFEAVRLSIPAGARFLPAGPRAPLYLLDQAVRSGVLPRRATLARDAARAAEQVRALLDGIRRARAEASDPAALREAMGKASDLVDPAALTTLLTSRRTPAVGEDRLQRLENAGSILAGAARALEETLLTVVHDNSLGRIEDGDFPGWKLVKDDDPCAAAEYLFDDQADAMADILRALRTARLEVDGLYDPARHDPWLAGFSWEAFSEEESRLLMPVVAIERDDAVARRGMQSLSRLLLSGRPVQAIVVTQPSRNPGTDPEAPPFSGYRLEPGYLGLSHREALVQQTSAARPLHMLEGLVKGLASARTALHIVAAGVRADGREPEVGAWLWAGAALEGRAHPFFRYDPAAGRGWARRFDIGGNAQIEEDWPRYLLTALREDGGDETLDLAFTFADFALLEPAFAGHFRVVPDGIPEADLVPVDAWLALSREDSATKIPFVWAVDGGGRLRRAAVTRRLVLAARDRLGFWRTLQELAGVKSEHVREAVERVKEEYESRLRAETERIAGEKEREVERARRLAAEDVVNRLTAALLDVDLSVLAPAGGPLGALRGMNVDQITGELVRLIDAASLDGTTERAGDPRADSMAFELMKLIDPGKL